MPELPEVEYTARQLRAAIVGVIIQNAQVFWEHSIGHPGVADFLTEIAGRRIEGIRRRGKYLLVDLEKERFLSIHRRMSGNFYLLSAGWDIDTSLRERDLAAWNTKGPTFVPGRPEVAPTETEYCRVCFNLSDGRRLLFTDPRKFGRIELWPRTCEAEVFAGLGPEPLSEEFSVERFAERLARHKIGIKQALLAQDVVAGVGNIYADEALFYARLHPLRRTNSLTHEETHLLHEGLIAVLTRAIEHGGTSFSAYRDLWGEAGENYNHVLVYQREGQPCNRCGTPIERLVIAQRSAHFCPMCQQINEV